MGHSERCSDLKTYWNRSALKCALCTVTPGYGITPNCGFDDDGGRHEPPHTECIANATFNDGSDAYCRPCAACARGFTISSACSTTSNIKCQDPGSGAAAAPVSQPTSSHHVSSVFSTTAQGSSLKPNAATILITFYPAHDVGILWAVPFAILISIMLVVICACLIYLKRKRGQHTASSHRRRSSYINAGFSPLGNNDLEHILSCDILTAPLQAVLDNLDVLEELVILLDPENQGVKNTKHLASHCSFPATWITYTYSMKDSKSPLKTLLEGVTSRHPDWTVGRLAKMLKHIERNDAIAVLTKLELNVMQV
ncbi:IGF-like family receptor 1 isoform X2 [Cyclopterus lumpus]|uniref:IGF-like family receptor 1 isoform X2 n=1 Tax=Cyclopterus lumpus TaxID=8103 RepID=UPI001486D984|nr:IGF-like family receptor 1 isoform X2 [Cyclopterus lumpus]